MNPMILLTIACVGSIAIACVITLPMMMVAASADRHAELMFQIEAQRRKEEADYLQTVRDNETPATQIP